METVPSCDTFQGTSLLIFSKSKHIATTQIRVGRKAEWQYNSSLSILQPHPVFMLLCKKLGTPFNSSKINQCKVYLHLCIHTLFIKNLLIVYSSS